MTRAMRLLKRGIIEISRRREKVQRRKAKIQSLKAKEEKELQA